METEPASKISCICIYLCLYSTLLDLSGFFSFLILYIVGRTSWTEISRSQGRYLHTELHKHRINAHRHPCLEWDSNPRSQCSSHCIMHQTARPPLSPSYIYFIQIMDNVQRKMSRNNTRRLESHSLVTLWALQRLQQLSWLENILDRK
jgi:hypothetical protein